MVQHRMAAMLERLATRHTVLSLHLLGDVASVQCLSEGQRPDAAAVDGDAEESSTLWRCLHTRLAEARDDGALSLHLEPEGDELRVRMQLITGLEESRIPIHAALARTIHLVGEKLREARKNQQSLRGFLHLTLGKEPLIVDTLLMPGAQGDTLHFYLIPQPDARPRLDEIGMDAQQSQECRELLSQPHGLIVISDADQLQRQRTVRAMAQELVSPERRLLSLEPAVHPLIPGCLQLATDAYPGDEDKSKTTDIDICGVDGYFIAADPSAQWTSWLMDEALDAALVVRGSRSNDSHRILARLLAQGATPEQLAQCLSAIIYQQSVLAICPSCSRPTNLNSAVEGLAEVSTSLASGDISDWLSRSLSHPYLEADGCEQCSHSGHSGLIKLFVIVRMNTAAQKHMMAGDIKQAARALDAGQALSARAMALARAGLIGLPEAMRLSRQHAPAKAPGYY